MPKFEVELPSGTYEVDAPNERKAWEYANFYAQQEEKPAPAAKPSIPAPAPSKERTWGESVGDLGASFIGGIGSLTQFPGQVYGLATGDFSDTGLLREGRLIQKHAENLKSQGLKAREAARAEAVQKAEQEGGQWGAFKAALGETITDPALLASFTAEQLPNIIPSIVTGGAAGALTKAGQLSAQQAAKGAAKVAAKEAAEDAAQKAAVKAGTTAAIQTGAIQQGADIGAGAYDMIYKELRSKGYSEEEAAAETINKARAAGASGYLLSILANRYLPGGESIEKILAGERMAGRGVLPRIGTGLATGAKEIPSEMLEETGGRFSQNLAMREVKPEQSLTEGLGETAGMSAAGALGMGTTTGVLGRRAAPPPAEVKDEEKPETTTETKTEAPQTKPARTIPTEFQELTEEQLKQEQELADQKEVKPPEGSLAELKQKITKLEQEYIDRAQRIAKMEAEGQVARGTNHLANAVKANKELLVDIEAKKGALNARTEAGEKDVGSTVTEAGGVSVPVAGQSSTDAATKGAGTSVTDGMVSPGSNAPAAAARKGQPAAPISVEERVRAMTDAELDEIMDTPWGSDDEYQAAKAEQARRKAAKPAAPAAPARDDLYDQVAKGLADGTMRPSVTNIRDTLKIGANRAAKILEQLEANNVVTAKNDKGLRSVVGKEKPTAPAKTMADFMDQDEIEGVLSAFEKPDDTPLASRGPLKAEAVTDPKLQQLFKAAKQVGVSPVAGETPQQLVARVRREQKFRQESEQETPIPGGKQVKLTTPPSAVPIEELSQQGIQPRKKEEPARAIIPENKRELYDEMAEEFNAQLDADIAAQKERGGERAEDRDETERLPAFNKLTDDEVDSYFDGVKDNTWAEHTAAAQTLSEHVSSKRKGSEFAGRRAVEKTKGRGVEDKEKLEAARERAQERELAEQAAARNYNRERGPMSDKTGLAYTFPIWGDLSQEAQDLYIATIGSNSAAEQYVTFGLLKRQIQAELLAKSKSDATLAAINEQIRVALQQQEEKLAKDARTKGEALPISILGKLFRGDISSVLDYLQDKAEGALATAEKSFVKLGKQGIPTRQDIRDAVTKNAYRALSSTLNNIPDFKVNVVFDPNLNKDEVAVYDYKTNTIFVGPNGLNETAVLHEMVHAATVKIIHQYFTDKSKLEPRAVESVEQLIKIMELAKPKLKTKDNSKYAHAFDNLYEFVAYALTDPDFQRELSQMQAPSIAKATAKTEAQADINVVARETGKLGQYDFMFDNLWDYFTGTLAYLYKLFVPNAKSTKLLAPTEKTRIERLPYEYEDTKAEALRKLEEKLGKLRTLRKSGAAVDEEISETEDLIDEVALAEERTKAREALGAKPQKKQVGLAEEEQVQVPDEITSLFNSLEDKTEKVKKSQRIQKELVNAPRFGVNNLERLELREAGYRGNFLLEAAAAVQQIMAAPSPEGMPTLAGRMQEGALPAKAAPQTKQAEKKQEDVSFEDAVQKQKARLPEQNTVGAVKKLLTTSAGQRKMVTAWQNDRYAIKFWEDSLERANKIFHAGKDKMNNIYTQIALSAARAKDIFLTKVETPAAELRAAIGKFAEAQNLSVEDALSQLQVYAIGQHEPERREAKFLLNVPLNNTTKIKFDGKTMTPANARQYIMDEFILNGTANKQEAKNLKKVLQLLATKYADAAGFSPSGETAINMNDAQYNVIGTYSPASIQAIRDRYERNKAQLDPVFKAIQKLQEVTAEMNRSANYWSKPVESLVNLYGWEHYVPFKGKAEASVGKLDYLLNFDSEQLGKELQDAPHAFEGRVSESDNSIVQTMTDATRAAMRAGRADLTLSIKNAIEQKLLFGTVSDPIPFKDRYNVGIDEEKKRSTVFHYNEDGSVQVLYIQDRSQLEAIRRTYQQSNPVIDMLNGWTSKLGQIHTRYNFAFAPMNFVRDMLTNAFTIGSEMSTADAARYIGAVASSVVNGGLGRAFKIATLYNQGKIPEIKRLAGGDKPRNQLSNKELKYREMYEYIQQGGMVSYLQGLSSQGTFQSLQKDLTSSTPKKWMDATNKVFDIYTDMFELASRSAAYSITKSSYMQGSKKLSEAEAATRAAGYVKGLANFEQVGKYGKAAGAMFMFFRPAATGAVRALETIAPMVRDVDTVVAEFEANNPEVAKDPKAVAAFRKDYEKQKKAATAMTFALMGLGALVYMMAMALSDDDELGRDRVATDDINRWTRYARFYIPGFEKPFQLPWGFGLGAFASSGAQMAALASGNASVKDVFNNIIEVGMDSFMPLPQSRINKFEQPAAWLMDTATPSILRPFFEWQMNIDALGREIYNNRNTRMGDAYTGGDNIPEIWKSAARIMVEATNGAVDVSPNTLYFFANNYGDGPARLAQTFGSWASLAQGEKNFDPRHDTLLFSSFFGAPSNFDAREFSAVEKQIQSMEQKLKMFKDNPVMEARYIAANPMAEHLVDLYNKGINRDLKQLRQEANEIRAMQISPKAKEAMLKNTIRAQNLEKRFLIEEFKAYGVRP